MSRIRTARRSQVKLKIAVSGLSGSGKTYSSLLLAKGLVGDWSKVGLIDSENGSGELYSHLGPYNYIDIRFDSAGKPIRDPHSPESYISAIREMVASGCDVIVIDSITHEWDGIGGCLESVERLGGRFSDWAKVTPRHKAFVDTILHAPVHIVATMRKKSDYVLGEEERGGKTKQKIEKVGLKDVQREGVEYEFTLQLTIDRRHLASAEKDRTELFANHTPFKIGEDIGQMLLAWANSGESVGVTAPVTTAADEIYSAQTDQKRKLMEWCKSVGITDGKTMGDISKDCMGIAMPQVLIKITTLAVKPLLDGTTGDTEEEIFGVQD